MWCLSSWQIQDDTGIHILYGSFWAGKRHGGKLCPPIRRNESSWLGDTVLRLATRCLRLTFPARGAAYPDLLPDSQELFLPTQYASANLVYSKLLYFFVPYHV